MKVNSLNFAWLFFIVPGASLTSYAQVEQVWAARLGSTETANDYARALGVDSADGIYVTGSVDNRSEYGTVKYDTAGNRIWFDRYGTNSIWPSQAAAALALDRFGNVYVTGGGPPDSEGSDYLTAKYDASGNRLWGVLYNRSVDSPDVATAIATDCAGNVYVTGRSGGGGTTNNRATVKYDPDGNELWVARSEGRFGDAAQLVAVDSAGNVFVTGGSAHSINSGYDYLTIKYDASGHQLWQARYSSPASNSDDKPRAIAVDTVGNVYVSGESPTPESIGSYATVKYDPLGIQLWTARYEAPAHSPLTLVAMALDGSGNVFVTGSTYNFRTGFDYVTVKYDANGNQVWVARYNSSTNYDIAASLTVDRAGSAYVTGVSIGVDSDYATVKYDSNGNQLWVARYNGPVNSNDTATAIGLDSLTNVYVTGYSVGDGTGTDYVTIKYLQYTVEGFPAITNVPLGQVVLMGTDLSFSVAATGSEPLNYQWRFNGAPISGATNRTLQLTNVQSSQRGDYSVVVSNSVGVTVSPEARLVVNVPAMITAQPISRSVVDGFLVVFRVGAAGTAPLTYQWRLNGSSLAQATNATLTLSNVQPADAGDYTVVVTNAFGSVTSAIGTLTVTLTMPLAEALDTPELIWRRGGDVPWLGQTNVTHDGVDAAESGTITNSNQQAWMETTVTGPGQVTFWWKVSSDPDSALSFYISGARFGGITWNMEWQTLSFSVPAGMQTLRWVYEAEDPGWAWPNKAWVDQISYTRNINKPPTITVQPIGQEVVAGGIAIFSVAVTNEAALPVTYRWRKGSTYLKTNILNERLDFFAIRNVQSSDAGSYNVVVTNAGGSVPMSRSVSLTVLSDSDGDGLPDTWERTNGLNEEDPADALLDSDNDGMNNSQEYTAGTEPTNSLSHLRINCVVGDGIPKDFLRVSFMAMSNKTYTLQWRGTMDLGWVNLLSFEARLENRIISLTNALRRAVPSGYYRVATPHQAVNEGGAHIRR
jgi:hypothetical protein